MYVKLPATRILPIDAFRGLTIFTMIFVNELAGVSGIPDWMKHADADADAMTFVDMVFPAFLFIVGMSIPFSIQHSLSKDNSVSKVLIHTATRSIALIVMGVFMVNAEGGASRSEMGMSVYLWMLLFCLGFFLVWFDYRSKATISIVLRVAGVLLLLVLAVLYRDKNGDVMAPHWWGILGLIGWAYLVASVLYLLGRANNFLLVLMILVCFGYYVLGHVAFRQNPFFRTALFSQGGHAVHTAIVLAGILLSLIFYKTDLLTERRHRYSQAVGLAFGMFLLGLALRPLLGVSKIYATPSWASFSIASCVLIFAAMYLLIEPLRVERWTSLVKPSAMQPLLVYLLPYIIYAAMKAMGLSFPGAFYHGAAGIMWSLCYASIIMLIGWVLVRVGVRLRL